MPQKQFRVTSPDKSRSFIITWNGEGDPTQDDIDEQISRLDSQPKKVETPVPDIKENIQERYYSKPLGAQGLTVPGKSHGIIADTAYNFGKRLAEVPAGMIEGGMRNLGLDRDYNQALRERAVEEKQLYSGPKEGLYRGLQELDKKYPNLQPLAKPMGSDPFGLSEVLPSLEESSRKDIQEKNWGGLAGNVALGALGLHGAIEAPKAAGRTVRPTPYPSSPISTRPVRPITDPSRLLPTQAESISFNPPEINAEQQGLGFEPPTRPPINEPPPTPAGGISLAAGSIAEQRARAFAGIDAEAQRKAFDLKLKQSEATRNGDHSSATALEQEILKTKLDASEAKRNWQPAPTFPELPSTQSGLFGNVENYEGGTLRPTPFEPRRPRVETPRTSRIGQFIGTSEGTIIPPDRGVTPGTTIPIGERPLGAEIPPYSPRPHRKPGTQFKNLAGKFVGEKTITDLPLPEGVESRAIAAEPTHQLRGNITPFEERQVPQESLREKIAKQPDSPAKTAILERLDKEEAARIIEEMKAETERGDILKNISPVEKARIAARMPHLSPEEAVIRGISDIEKARVLDRKTKAETKARNKAERDLKAAQLKAEKAAAKKAGVKGRRDTSTTSGRYNAAKTAEAGTKVGMFNLQDFYEKLRDSEMGRKLADKLSKARFHIVDAESGRPIAGRNTLEEAKKYAAGINANLGAKAARYQVMDNETGKPILSTDFAPFVPSERSVIPAGEPRGKVAEFVSREQQKAKGEIKPSQEVTLPQEIQLLKSYNMPEEVRPIGGSKVAQVVRDLKFTGIDAGIDAKISRMKKIVKAPRMSNALWEELRTLGTEVTRHPDVDPSFRREFYTSSSEPTGPPLGPRKIEKGTTIGMFNLQDFYEKLANAKSEKAQARLKELKESAYHLVDEEGMPLRGFDTKEEAQAKADIFNKLNKGMFSIKANRGVEEPIKAEPEYKPPSSSKRPEDIAPEDVFDPSSLLSTLKAAGRKAARAAGVKSTNKTSAKVIEGAASQFELKNKPVTGTKEIPNRPAPVNLKEPIGQFMQRLRDNTKLEAIRKFDITQYHARQAAKARSVGQEGGEALAIKRKAAMSVPSAKEIRFVPLDLPQKVIDTLINTTDRFYSKDVFKQNNASDAIRAMNEGKYVAPYNRNLLSEAFPEQYRTEIMNLYSNIPFEEIKKLAGPVKTLVTKTAKEAYKWTLGSTRTLRSAYDFGVSGIQARSAMRTKAFYSAFKEASRAMKSEKYYKAKQKLRFDDPYFDFITHDMGVHIADLEKARPEPFTYGNITLEKSAPIRAFQRYSVEFLNHIRFENAKLFAKLAEKRGIDMGNVEEMRSIGRGINEMTGYGSLTDKYHIPAAEKFLSHGIWSTRLTASRINYLKLFDPREWSSPGTKFASKQRAYNLATVAGVSLATMQLAEAMGWKAHYNPYDPKFGKIEKDDTTIDTTAAFGSLVSLLARSWQLASTGEIKSSTGKKITGRMTGVPDLAISYLENKLAPNAALTLKIAQQINPYTGKPYNLPAEAVSTAIPFVVENAMDAIKDLTKDDPDMTKLFMLIPGMAGINVYSSDKKRTTPVEDILSFTGYSPKRKEGFLKENLEPFTGGR